MRFSPASIGIWRRPCYGTLPLVALYLPLSSLSIFSIFLHFYTLKYFSRLLPNSRFIFSFEFPLMSAASLATSMKKRRIQRSSFEHLSLSQQIWQRFVRGYRMRRRRMGVGACDELPVASMKERVLEWGSLPYWMSRSLLNKVRQIHRRSTNNANDKCMTGSNADDLWYYMLLWR